MVTIFTMLAWLLGAILLGWQGLLAGAAEQVVFSPRTCASLGGK
jgi:hypothetical protein